MFYEQTAYFMNAIQLIGAHPDAFLSVGLRYMKRSPYKGQQKNRPYHIILDPDLIAQTLVVF